MIIIKRNFFNVFMVLSVVMTLIACKTKSFNTTETEVKEVVATSHSEKNGVVENSTSPLDTTRLIGNEKSSISKDKKTKKADTENKNEVASTPVIESDFEEIRINGMPSYSDVLIIFEKSGLAGICKKNNIDQMDMDLMVLKTGIYPFDEFKNRKLTIEPKRMFKEVFPEQKLREFYNLSRMILKMYKRNQG